MIKLEFFLILWTAKQKIEKKIGFLKEQLKIQVLYKIDQICKIIKKKINLIYIQFIKN